MMPSSSTAKIQASRDGERRGGGRRATATGLIFFRKRQLCITGSFARYPQAEASNVEQILVGPTHNRKFRPQTAISYKSWLGTRCAGIKTDGIQ
jgi:hypothetical protein